MLKTPLKPYKEKKGASANLPPTALHLTETRDVITAFSSSYF